MFMLSMSDPCTVQLHAKNRKKNNYNNNQENNIDDSNGNNKNSIAREWIVYWQFQNKPFQNDLSTQSVTGR